MVSFELARKLAMVCRISRTSGTIASRSTWSSLTSSGVFAGRSGLAMRPSMRLAISARSYFDSNACAIALVRWKPPRLIVRAVIACPSRTMHRLVRRWPRSRITWRSDLRLVAGGERARRRRARQRSVDDRRRVQRARLRAVRLQRRQVLRDLVALGGARQHRRPLVADLHHRVVEHDVVERVHDLALETVADDAGQALAQESENGQIEPDREHVAGQRQVGRRLGRDLGEGFLDRVGLPLEQRRVAGGHGGFEQTAQVGLAEADLEQHELDRERAEIDAADGVRHAVYSSRQYWMTPFPCSDMLLIVK